MQCATLGSGTIKRWYVKALWRAECEWEVSAEALPAWVAGIRRLRRFGLGHDWSYDHSSVGRVSRNRPMRFYV